MPIEPYVGEIMLFAGHFAPRGWADCDGRLLPVSSNTALFSLIGATYGGNGYTNFALPDLRGRFPMGTGTGWGLTPRYLGYSPGVAEVALTPAQIPVHGHSFAQPATGGTAFEQSPRGVVVARAPLDRFAPPTAGPQVEMQTVETESVGAGAPHPNRQPFLALRFIIALQGVFPPRP